VNTEQSKPMRLATVAVVIILAAMFICAACVGVLGDAR
jgi:hypothetical protein